MGCICPVIIPYYNMHIYFTKKWFSWWKKGSGGGCYDKKMGPKGGRFKQKFDSAGWSNFKVPSPLGTIFKWNSPERKQN